MQSDQQRTLRPLADTDWPKAIVKPPQGGKAVLFALSHESNESSRLINDLLEKKINMVIARNRFVADGETFPAGTVLIDSSGSPSGCLTNSSLRLIGLASRPTVAVDNLRRPRLGLYKPWMASMDEGWTRWVLEQYHFIFRNVDNKETKAGKLKTAYDVILLPDISKEVIVEGKCKLERWGAVMTRCTAVT